jgi:hypothetical protein
MPSTGPPDILARRLERLTDNDLRFLVENFPEPAASYEDIARIFASLPITLESTLDAEYAYRKIFENGRELVEISPFLLFNVLLHRCIGSAYTQTERVVVNYMANLLGLFVCTERVYRPEAGNRQSYEYFVALAAEAARADERRRFLLQAHIGNYALYLRGSSAARWRTGAGTNDGPLTCATMRTWAGYTATPRRPGSRESTSWTTSFCVLRPPPRAGDWAGAGVSLPLTGC